MIARQGQTIMTIFNPICPRGGEGEFDKTDFQGVIAQKILNITPPEIQLKIQHI